MARVSRRRFLSQTVGLGAAAFAVPTIIPRTLLGANERIVMGLIGCGGQGRDDMRRLVAAGGGSVEFAALCDVYEPQWRRLKRSRAPMATGHADFRSLLDRNDIDAVSIATPDHWHALTAIAACQAGKDIYCQKPLSLTIAEGRAMVTAARRYGRVFQTGSQQRSSAEFHQACEIVQRGRLGKIRHIHTAVGRNRQMGWEPDSDPPRGLDWNLYLGPAPQVRFNWRRFIHDFRWFYDYSGGHLTDWGAHHNDIAQWALGMDKSGPVEIEGVGTFPTSGPMDTPVVFNVKYKYADGATLTCSSDKDGESAFGCWIYGADGEIFVTRGRIESPTEGLLQRSRREDPKKVKLYESRNHHLDFLSCVRTRARPICDVEIGHRSATVCHLGNIAIRLGRAIRWDPEAEVIVGDEAANRWVSRPMRAPWSV